MSMRPASDRAILALLQERGGKKATKVLLWVGGLIIVTLIITVVIDIVAGRDFL